ncbi:MAG: cupin domain-containing protein [Myxococcota bacterium]|jgi:predicted cupin superfamily sugar epimerase
MSGAQKELSPVVAELIERLRLEPHPEGGFYRETWRSPVTLEASSLPAGYSAARSAVTSIYFLLPTGVCSALHRVRSEELWMHHQGDDVLLGIGPTETEAEAKSGETILGQGLSAQLQAVVPPMDWQRAEALPGPAGYALVGCVVAPGFDFADFEMAD